MDPLTEQPAVETGCELPVLLDTARRDAAELRAELHEAGEAVRSLAEDLAVARARSTTAAERSRAAAARACAAVERAQELSAQVAERLRRAEAVRAGAAARAEALHVEVEHLTTALRRRPFVEHVVGMVMLSLGCDADAAWRALSVFSQHTNRKVRDLTDALAARVAAGEDLPEELLAALRLLHAAEQAREHAPDRGEGRGQDRARGRSQRRRPHDGRASGSAPVP
ncbi:ANTAR domain-containing protein [Kineococcus gypseus]|uniref:ANTAR domain-containing protein n=1 Tax=Kineococcus gypseus TaxID=1637102 RepID=UPI003D7D0051